MADKVLYREFHTLRWLVWTLFGVSVVFVVIATAQSYPMNGGLVLVAIILFFVSQHLAAIRRWNRIELTPPDLESARSWRESVRGRHNPSSEALGVRQVSVREWKTEEIVEKR